ncbi:MAG: NTP transferase domain-containing protein [Acidimicrobiia bacterium]|nr:NTP transferase domain-containing protein [Acidimicrobiia bacterium]
MGPLSDFGPRASSGEASGTSAGAVGLVLAAGAGTGLRPLTYERPKPLCPMGTTTLLDAAIDRLEGLVDTVVVNCHHGAVAIRGHLGRRVQGDIDADGRVRPNPAADGAPGAVWLSEEQPAALGTAGAVGRLAPWLAGRPLVVLNGDTLTDAPVTALLDGWDGEEARLLVHGDRPFSPRSLVAGALLAPADVARCPTTPSGLYEQCWRDAHSAGRLGVVHHHGRFADCGVPRRYLDANLAELDEPDGSVIGAGARVDGAVSASVVWPGAVVRRGEVLHRAIRTTGGRTVLVR